MQRKLCLNFRNSDPSPVHQNRLRVVRGNIDKITINVALGLTILCKGRFATKRTKRFVDLLIHFVRDKSSDRLFKQQRGKFSQYWQDISTHPGTSLKRKVQKLCDTGQSKCRVKSNDDGKDDTVQKKDAPYQHSCELYC